jgi:preprotein translocase subunit SecD
MWKMDLIVKRAAVALVLLALLGIAACGEEQTPATRQAYPSPMPGDGGLLLAFALDLEKGKALGWTSSATDEVAAKASILRIARERLRGLGFDPKGASLHSDQLVVEFPPVEPSAESLVVDTLTARGLLEIRIEVRPDAWHLARSARHEESAPTRLGMWADPTEGSFEAFVLAEMARLRKAREAKQPYVPSDPRYRLVQGIGTSGAQGSDFHVVEVAHPPSMFGGQTLENPRIDRHDFGTPLVMYDVRADRQEPFRAWTERHIGLPLAFLVDGQLTSAPIIQSALSQSIEVRVTGYGTAGSERAAQVFAAASTSGPLPCPLHLARRSRRP